MQDKRRLRAVVDTNLIISAAIVAKSPPNKLIRSWLVKAFILIASHEQLEEMKEVSQRKKLKAIPLFTERITELIDNIEFIAEIAQQIALKDLPLHGRDPEDDFILAAGLGGDADYLVTEDEALLALSGNTALGKLKIVTVKEFLKII